ncbi:MULTISPECIES: SRPBCC family protein [unclassified Streptomyces]|uniref:SRPBCC family protein n=1 Tax=unclassified Streptomyces TaxID=2593676 RepID=UPI002E2980B4|nr:SRPBCC family protein [Streptomyces sp. NBC_00223]
MDWSRYRFRSAWQLDAAPDAVYAVLERPEEYPEWWPQVREVCGTGETTAVLRFRSVLPYDLTVTARSTRHDPEARVLEIALTGEPLDAVKQKLAPLAERRCVHRGRETGHGGGAVHRGDRHGDTVAP